MSKHESDSAGAEYKETVNFLRSISGPSLRRLRTEEDFDTTHIRHRSAVYNKYLSFYVFFFRIKSWTQWSMRVLFFLAISAASILIVQSCFSCISKVLTSKQIDVSGVVAIVSSLIGMLTTFIALPEIVAKNLFPQKEDDISAELFNKMFEHDVELRKLRSKPEKQPERSPDPKRDSKDNCE